MRGIDAEVLAHASRERTAAAIVVLSIALTIGCTFAPIDHEGQLAPCLPGWVEEAGRCHRAMDASGSDAAEVDAGVDAGVDADASDEVDAGCAPRCEGNVIVACDESRATCAERCETSPMPHCVFEPSFGVGWSDDALGPLVVPAGSTYVLDTATGAITDDVVGEVRAAGVGLGGSGIYFDPLGSTIGVFRASSIEIHGTLRAVGPSLALVATTEIVIDGTLDVSADGTTRGPGGEAGSPRVRTSCAPVAPLGEGGGGSARDSGYYGPGGGGGGGGGEGARGGDTSPHGSCGSDTAPGEGGAAVLTGEVLRGGFGGGTGGDDLVDGMDDVSAAGGAGGGAVLLSAGVRIHLASSGTIDACGGGGEGGGAVGGGGGGGSGGLVVLEAPLIARDSGSMIGANGGGGGAAGVDQCATPTFACFDPEPSASHGDDGAPRITSGAAGGISRREAYGSSGGAGSDSLGVADSPAADARFNGGGGGGGAGRIIMRGSSSGSGFLSPETASLVTETTL